MRGRNHDVRFTEAPGLLDDSATFYACLHLPYTRPAFMRFFRFSFRSLFGHGEGDVHTLRKIIKNGQIGSHFPYRSHFNRKNGIIRLRIENGHVMMGFAVGDVPIFKSGLSALPIFRVKFHAAVIFSPTKSCGGNRQGKISADFLRQGSIIQDAIQYRIADGDRDFGLRGVI